ncbi:MAG: M28 family peptidase [Clostridia bacterium]|nr:M28 family peptidase [Clostridia bacterium]
MKYVEKIAVTDQTERKNVILSVLDGLEIPYEIHDTVRDDQPVSNIIVSLNPSSHRLVIGAHWDSVDGSTGANDNASSCSILLRLCETLKTTDKSVDLVFFDKEEKGCPGSKAYIDEVGRENISAMVNLDVCGAGKQIVIWSKGNVDNPAFYGILTSANLDKHGVTDLPWLPYGDDRTFDAAEIPNITVCVLNPADLEVFRTVSAKIAAGQPLSEEENKAFHGVEVMKTMHNGENDSIASVNPDALNTVYNFVESGL